MSLYDLIGHGGVVDLLTTEAARPTHAYLFAGPGSVGKSTAARGFAALLLCPRRGVHEGECRSCRLALAETHPDLIVVEPEGASSLGVDQAREVVSRASLAPVEAGRTVFLFPEAGAMTEQAANALLKTLEEPVADAVFLLVAESEDDFPETVASRCRVIRMGRVPEAELASALAERGMGQEEAAVMAAVAGGRPGLALSLAGRPDVARFREMWLSIPDRLDPHPGTGHRVAADVLSELAPLVEEAVGESSSKDRAQRARRRAEMSLLVNGLELLASRYADSASLQLGGPVRNSDLELADLTEVSPRRAVDSVGRVLDAVVDIEANLRRELVLATLFTGLGAGD